MKKKIKIVKKITFQRKFEKKLSDIFYVTFDCGWTWSDHNFNLQIRRYSQKTAEKLPKL